jgi:16S rRNA (cytosine1402-N4)-methyltransferase
LEEFLPEAVKRLKSGGVVMVVTFHSLEDKIVTKFMREQARPKEVDGWGNREQEFKLLTKSAVKASEEELEQNWRARSAGLRVLQRVGE